MEENQEIQDLTNGSEGESQEVESNEEDVVIIGNEETPPQAQKEEAPEWVKELRKSHRQIQKENKELKRKLESREKEKPVKVTKPTLEECDYDNELYEKKLFDFYQAKRVEEEQNKKAQQAWQDKLNSYEEKKKSLKVRDYEDAEAIIQDTFSETQQGIILQGADNPAIVVYALGKDEKKAKELSQITDPIRFAFEVAKLETQMKVTRRRPSVEPEKIVSGSQKISGSAHDKKLAELREKASKTGDMSEVLAYRRKHNL